MEELKEIIATIATMNGVRPVNILFGGDFTSVRARAEVSYILYTGFPHLLNEFVESSVLSRVTLTQNIRETKEMIRRDADYRIKINEIRKTFGMPFLRASKNKKNIPSDTKVLFGFDYSESDVWARRTAMKNAASYMKNISDIGRQPLPYGILISPLSPKTGRRRWYND